MKTVLTIAGSDCSGGAGIQADLKTITVHKMYGMSVITALTAQNTQKVFEVVKCTPEFVEAQLDAVFTDIYPDAVKIGMVSSAEIIESIVNKLTEYHAQKVILDPVMIATSGRSLLNDDAFYALKNKLMTITHVITPNIPEAELLSGISISTVDDMIKAAEEINKFYKGHILIKGGHLVDRADDLIYSGGEIIWIKGNRIGQKERHGTGCTLSSAIACNLAKELSLEESVKRAKAYVAGALRSDTNLGYGSSPLSHHYSIKEK
ncbi:bifunctional hydroxymethylpyrimidine kinase/phosphomethylpyrimidine kinase [Cellulosilyticum sp. I15G10I2]|uniref:bifunctional hydroxymethylpyrimidine kinase/phosphomethylpyrimidine kinase n=1 Tax=Cellulosilyticum sp. I15G10I2 TaxID=1892843 RepID=UPI00085BCA64|nr:bifunctional hydroxymethylpyrimidine kinase/phosphomethylpyrimidine kinase [Cellulosilyticum sp. I15G10I2]